MVEHPQPHFNVNQPLSDSPYECLFWPYSSVCMYNEMNKVCVGCESIILGETKDSYKFMIDFMCESAPGRKRDEIDVVAGDGFFNQGMITDYFQLPNDQFLADHYHLHKYVLKERFGDKYNLLKDDLTFMVTSQTSGGFDAALRRAKLKLMLNNTIDSENTEKLQKLASEKNSYIVHCLNLQLMRN